MSVWALKFDHFKGQISPPPQNRNGGPQGKDERGEKREGGSKKSQTVL